MARTLLKIARALVPLRGCARRKLLFNRHGELQGVERVEPKAASEERCVVLDGCGISPLEVQLRDEKALNQRTQLANIHLNCGV